MKVENLLVEKRSAILEKWVDLILETYPAETAKFLKDQKNRFANPVGYTISQEVDHLFDQLIKNDFEEASRFLENVVRIRAIQNFTPTQAISFIFTLKDVVRHEIGKEIAGKGIIDELLAFESRIDKLAMMAFDIYMKCYEKIYEIRSTELRNRTYRLLKRANVLHELDEQESEVKDCSTESLNEAR
ncbi:MAG: RsbRD N-terminal domain-containing protein [Pseudomonadota bacterium]